MGQAEANVCLVVLVGIWLYAMSIPWQIYFEWLEQRKYNRRDGGVKN